MPRRAAIGRAWATLDRFELHAHLGNDSPYSPYDSLYGSTSSSISSSPLSQSEP